MERRKGSDVGKIDSEFWCRSLHRVFPINLTASGSPEQPSVIGFLEDLHRGLGALGALRLGNAQTEDRFL